MYTEADSDSSSDEPGPEQSDLGGLLVVLLKGVLYQENDPQRWAHLLTLHNRVKDYVAILGLVLILDEAEGYAFLRSRQENAGARGEDASDIEIPRLMARRQLSFPVSLLLALLRKNLAEFDARSGDTRLVLTRDAIVDSMRLFLPDSSNEAKLVDQIERHINRVVELGFLRRLKPGAPSRQPDYEVRRIIKAYVDAQWLAKLDQKLETYREHLVGEKNADE